MSLAALREVASRLNLSAGALAVLGGAIDARISGKPCRPHPAHQRPWSPRVGLRERRIPQGSQHVHVCGRRCHGSRRIRRCE